MNEVLQLDADFLSCVLYEYTLRTVEIERFGGILRDEYDIEATVLQHTVELSLTGTKLHGLGGIIISNVDGSILTLLIVIVHTLVLVELELPVLTCIDIEIDEFSGFLVTPLHLRTEGDDSTLTDKDGDALVWSVNHQ